MSKKEVFIHIKNMLITFVFGGLLVFSVMSLTVLKTLKIQNEELTKNLDSSRYEAARLLANAKVLFTNKKYTEARTNLAILLERQPGSRESTEGQKLLPIIMAEESAKEALWLKVAGKIEAQWSKQREAKLRADAETERLRWEADLDRSIKQDWERAMEQVKQEWLING